MSRLRHSYAGHLRLMQMSSKNLYVFVEGVNSDPYFFAQICSSTQNLVANVEICTAQQLPGGTGGKQSLLSFFSYLRQRKSLVSSLGGQSTASIFFLDKDLDDLKRIKKRSSHLIYTEHYDIQNYIYCHGDILTGAASAASVDPARLEAVLRDSENWCQRMAQQWRDWIALCLCVLSEGIECEVNYRLASSIQTRPCGPTDNNKLSVLKNTIVRRRGIPIATFEQKVSKAVNKVDKYFALSQHQRLFKGKWFANALSDEIERIMAGTPFDNNRLANRLTCSIAATLDFNEPWADHFKIPILNVAATL